MLWRQYRYLFLEIEESLPECLEEVELVFG